MIYSQVFPLIHYRLLSVKHKVKFQRLLFTHSQYSINKLYSCIEYWSLNFVRATHFYIDSIYICFSNKVRDKKGPSNPGVDIWVLIAKGLNAYISIFVRRSDKDHLLLILQSDWWVAQVLFLFLFKVKSCVSLTWFACLRTSSI